MDYLIKNARIINEGKTISGDVLVHHGRIEKMGHNLSHPGAKEINAEKHFLMPGAIDDQVHFREPGLTHKGDIHSESRAAVAGGVTSYMEMPNTVPPATTQQLLQDKYSIAGQKSLANFSFYMGTSNDNYEEVMKTDLQKICGLKIFMGASTGNMLVDNPSTLERIFTDFPGLIATHCEDEHTIRENLAAFRERFGDNIPVEMHPDIRSEKACFLSSSLAIELAKKHNTRLHILHISTAKETHLFRNDIPLEQKRITAEACVHHLWFSKEDYATQGHFIKWNPAIKTAADREAILQAVLDDRIDVIATDHAPHTYDEKQQVYTKAPSGGPLVQHGLIAMMELHHKGKISMEKIVDKMCHKPAIMFNIKERGFIREGYKADLVLFRTDKPWKVSHDNILYKCGWSPFDGVEFHTSVTHTFVNGHLAYHDGEFDESLKGERMTFAR